MIYIVTRLCLHDNSRTHIDSAKRLNRGDSVETAKAAGAAALADSEKKTGSALIEKYEIGTGKNKINVRIFKEPPAG